MNALLQDLRRAARMLAKRPGIAVMAVLSLSSGIALTVTTYGILSAVFARPTGIVRPEDLLRVASPLPKQEGVADLRRELAPLADAAAFTPLPMKLVVSASEERILVELVTENYFSVLGLVPAQGRGFTPSDLAAPSNVPPVVISYALWQNRFFGHDVRGRTVLIDNEPLVIVGVAPRGFRGLTPIVRSDAWALLGTVARDKARLTFFSVLARMRGGATPILVQRVVEATVRRPDFAAMGDKDRVFVGRESNAGFGLSVVTGVLTAVVGLLLVVACANVAGLLLARMEERRREMAIRAALGAGRWPVVRQLLVEGALLSAAGSLAGLLLALWLADAALALIGGNLLGLTAVDTVLDQRALLLVCGLTTLETLAVSMAPVWFATRIDLSTCMKGDVAATGTGRARLGFRDVFVATQLAIAFVLLVGVAVAVMGTARHSRSLATLLRDDVVVAIVHLPAEGAERITASDALLDRARALPGARTAAFAEMPIPRQGVPRVVHAHQAGTTSNGGAPSWTSVTANANAVSAEYFRIVRLHIVSGRTFGRGEDAGAARSVILTTSLARRLWPGADPLGRQVHLDETSGPPWDVVGIAEDPPLVVEGTTGFCFLPVALSSRASVGLVVEEASSRLALGPALASLVRSAKGPSVNDPEAAVVSLGDFVRKNDVFALTFDWVTRFTLGLALLACALTLAGFYAAVAHLFARRTAEIGIRIALGARRWEVRWLVLRRALALAWTGILFGLPVALAEGFAVPRGVFDTRWTPPSALIAAALAVTAIAAVAAYVPARRASAINPTSALRCE
jgi:putative ABC transport system permease protein